MSPCIVDVARQTFATTDSMFFHALSGICIACSTDVALNKNIYASTCMIILVVTCTHHSHSILVYEGMYVCKKCVSTPSNKLMNLSTPCTRPGIHGNINIKAYKKGTKLRGFPDWPYKSVHMMDNVIVNETQHEIDRMQRTYGHRYEFPDSDSNQEDIDIDLQAESPDAASESVSE